MLKFVDMRKIVMFCGFVLFMLFGPLLYAQTEIIIHDKQFDERLSGRWELLKIERDNDTIVPNKIDYFVYFSKKSINFNRDVNTCFIEDFTIKNNEIISRKGAGCTRVCCDGRTDKFSLDLKYTGKYLIISDTLVINNDEGKHILKKSIK